MQDLSWKSSAATARDDEVGEVPAQLLTPAPLSDFGETNETNGDAASAQPSSVRDSVSMNSSSRESSSTESSSESDSDSEEDSSSSSSQSSDEEPPRDEPAEDEASEAYLRVRVRMLDIYLRRLEERVRRRRSRDAAWLQRDINRRLEYVRPSTSLLRQVMLKRTYRRTFSL